MSETKKPGVIRPFFIAAYKEYGDYNRICDVSSDNVAGIRPAYMKDQQRTDRTALVLNATENNTNIAFIDIPYPVVKGIFADHGYEFIDKAALMAAAAAHGTKTPQPR